MAFDLSFGSLTSARERLMAMRDGEEVWQTRALNAGLSAGAAFGFGWLTARYGKSHPTLVAPMGVPLPALVGAVATAVGLFDLGLGFEEQIGAFGNGALSLYVGSLGARLGSDMAAKAKGAGMYVHSGASALPAGGPAFHVNASQAARQGAPVQRFW